MHEQTKAAQQKKGKAHISTLALPNKQGSACISENQPRDWLIKAYICMYDVYMLCVRPLAHCMLHLFFTIKFQFASVTRHVNYYY